MKGFFLSSLILPSPGTWYIYGGDSQIDRDNLVLRRLRCASELSAGILNLAPLTETFQ